MPFWRLYYHLTWATKERRPLLTPETELYGYLVGKVKSLHGTVHAIGGVDDHVHLIVSVPPTMSISDFVGQLKGASAYHINHTPGAEGNFGWQRGYGAISVGPSGLEQACNYARNQKEHHSRHSTVGALEHLEE